MVLNNEINKIKENINKNITKIYNYNKKNNKSNFRYFKLFSFFINYKSNHFEQLIKKVITVKRFFDNTRINDILSILFK